MRIPIPAPVPGHSASPGPKPKCAPEVVGMGKVVDIGVPEAVEEELVIFSSPMRNIRLRLAFTGRRSPFRPARGPPALSPVTPVALELRGGIPLRTVKCES